MKIEEISSRLHICNQFSFNPSNITCVLNLQIFVYVNNLSFKHTTNWKNSKSCSYLEPGLLPSIVTCAKYSLESYEMELFISAGVNGWSGSLSTDLAHVHNMGWVFPAKSGPRRQVRRSPSNFWDQPQGGMFREGCLGGKKRTTVGGGVWRSFLSM